MITSMKPILGVDFIIKQITKKADAEVMCPSKTTQLDRNTYFQDFPRVFMTHGSQTELSLLSPDYDELLTEQEIHFQAIEHRMR